MLSLKFLFQEKDAHSLAFVRIAFALSICWAMTLDLFYREEAILNSILTPEILFKYQFFEWVEPPSELWVLYAVHWIVIFSSLAVAFGFYYYHTLFITVLGYAYLFLLNSGYYLNHAYLLILAGILLLFLPANRALAIDCARSLPWKKGVVPAWSILAFAVMLEIILIYAGIVKLNSDWLFRGEPLRTWIEREAEWHMLGDLAQYQGVMIFASWSTALIHLIGAPLLWFKKTRMPVFLLYCFFHALNSYTFNITIFPFYTAAFTTIFFAPNWPLQFKDWLIKKYKQLENFYSKREKKPVSFFNTQKGQIIVISIVSLFLLVHAALPLRSYIYAGNTSWNEEGQKFSWRMMLRDKRIDRGIVHIKIRNPENGDEWKISHNQVRQMVGSNYVADWVFLIPQLTIQYVHFLEDKWKKEHKIENVEIYMYSLVSLNAHKPALLYDPKLDLSEKSWNFTSEDWILPHPERP